MSAISYQINLTGGAKQDILWALNQQILPHMHQAVRAIAQHTTAQWQAKVHSAKLWSGEKDLYAGSISWKMTGELSAMVEADYKHASEIETGRPARDLKRMLDTSNKVRRTTQGKRFLVIPFRHNTPGNNALAPSMPQAIYGMAKGMEASTVTSSWRKRRAGEVTMLSPKTGMQPAPAHQQTPFLSRVDTKSAATVAKRTYAWGGAMSNSAMKQAGIDPETRRRYAGMVKMDTSTPGGAKSSAYLTFRIMAEGSKGWIVPAQPGQYIAKKVAEEMQPKATEVFQAAVTQMLKGQS